MARHALLVCVALLAGCAAEEIQPVALPSERGRATFEVMGELVELDYVIDDGQYVVADDIVLKPTQRIADGDERLRQGLFKYGSTTTSYRWPLGTVPYTISSNVTNPTAVKAAMAEWTNKTGIKWIPRTNQAGYVTVTELSGNGVCRAQLGYDGTQQFVYLRDTRSGYSACPMSIIVHELGHTLGFWHEQQRSERDTYVRVNSACIPTGSNAFTILTSGVMKVGGYDINSTMHYRSTTLNKSGCGGYSIYKKDGSLLLHDWSTLSSGDIAGVAQIYGGTGDADGDGVKDINDNCRTNSNATQVDTDKDNKGNACDTDDDGDGDLDTADNCPLVSNATQTNTDGDSLGNACDTDDDNDGKLDGADNCPLVSNATQTNTDGDSLGNACDTDDDNDGKLDGADNCPLVANAAQSDVDGDGKGDACDAETGSVDAGGMVVDAGVPSPDSDADGVADELDNCALPNTDQADANLDGVGDACQLDADGDGHFDDADNCPGSANVDQADGDADAIGDVCEDEDGDGVLDSEDNCPGIDDPDQTDTDRDGVGDACDPAAEVTETSAETSAEDDGDAAQVSETSNVAGEQSGASRDDVELISGGCSGSPGAATPFLAVAWACELLRRRRRTRTEHGRS